MAKRRGVRRPAEASRQLKLCQSCVFNPVQYGGGRGALGTSVRHAVLLQDADHTTCGRQLRKDLQLGSAEAEPARHALRFLLDAVLRLRQSGRHEPAAAEASTSPTGLRRWITAKGAKMARAALPWERDRAHGAALHEAREPAACALGSRPTEPELAPPPRRELDQLWRGLVDWGHP